MYYLHVYICLQILIVCCKVMGLLVFICIVCRYSLLMYYCCVVAMLFDPPLTVNVEILESYLAVVVVKAKLVVE